MVRSAPAHPEPVEGRTRFEDIEITLRAYGAFGDREVLGFCNRHKLGFSLGLKGNERLRSETADLAEDVLAKMEETRTDQRTYTSFMYKAGSWKHEERVVAKVETVRGTLNIRYLLTSRPYQKAERAYAFYCVRGDSENRIKEMKIDLAAGRTSCQLFLSNQFRLILHAAACVLWRAVQDALAGTTWANRQIGTLRRALVKVGARVVQTVRKIWMHLPTSCPHKGIWRYLHGMLQPQPI